ncbi:MAG: hypothetical protein DME96_06695 [Verrucomicrobia bacterium]|nr:MAG: hypothetical protein DME96_06695 [Verrucomicrobiota bacterium]
MSLSRSTIIAIIVTLWIARAWAQQSAPEATSTSSAISAGTASPSPTPVVFSSQTLAELKRLQQAALRSDYAYKQVAHLANNIGPRLSGSSQAAKSIEYVASELKAIGCEVQLEKVMVPHWMRGEETAGLVEFPGQAQSTMQKIVLCALGGSVATPPEGIEAEVIAVRNFDELKSMPRDKVAGKIVLFNYPFDKQMAAEGRGILDRPITQMMHRKFQPAQLPQRTPI